VLQSGATIQGKTTDNWRWAVTSPTRHSPPAPATDKQRRTVTTTAPPQRASNKGTRQVQGQARKSKHPRTSTADRQPKPSLNGQSMRWGLQVRPVRAANAQGVTLE